MSRGSGGHATTEGTRLAGRLGRGLFFWFFLVDERF